MHRWRVGPASAERAERLSLFLLPTDVSGPVNVLQQLLYRWTAAIVANLAGLLGVKFCRPGVARPWT